MENVQYSVHLGDILYVDWRIRKIIDFWSSLKTKMKQVTKPV